MKKKRKKKYDEAYQRKKEKQRLKYQQQKKAEKKLKGIVHFCLRCKKKTEHKASGEHYVNYAERCKICNQIAYSEILRKDWKDDGKP